MTAVEAPLEVREPDGIREFVSDWRTHLRAKNRADSTIDAYLDSMAMLVNCLDDEDISMVAPDIGRRELERYFEYLRQRPNFRAGESLSHSYIAKQEIVELSPFYKMEVPHLPDNYPTVFREKELKALLATTKGKAEQANGAHGRERLASGTRRRRRDLPAFVLGFRLAGEQFSRHRGVGDHGRDSAASQN
ncbi:MULTISPECIES: hypothetical protein [Amycolatopsis]|uniref:Integrase SAM-like N-terminal domain-containing protein n=1 Tax=Amycolatopsis albidoflavus TaxID=102226 RepID=A0ABW5I398_9PSEU